MFIEGGDEEYSVLPDDGRGVAFAGDGGLPGYVVGRAPFDGEVLFEHEQEGNTIKITVEKAVEESANLRYADLRYARLQNADLQFAKLQNAYLQNADLKNADLKNADLQNVDLRNADLRSADLRNAGLKFARLPKSDIVISENYTIHIRPDMISIGCQLHKSISYWRKLSYKMAEEKFGDKAGNWWHKWKPIVLLMAEQLRKQNKGES